jgi:hypothetical protein
MTTRKRVTERRLGDDGEHVIPSDCSSERMHARPGISVRLADCEQGHEASEDQLWTASLGKRFSDPRNEGSNVNRRGGIDFDHRPSTGDRLGGFAGPKFGQIFVF